MTKQCIFCGGRVNSKEDVWPKWMLKLLRKSDDEKVPMQTRRYKEAPKEWMTIDSALKVGNVCRGCNNGWMSRLENDVRPILSPMIVGTSGTVTASQQERIITWLTKTALMFDSLDKGEVFYDVLDRYHFRQTVTPFSDTYGWLGHYPSTSGIRSFADHRTLKTKLNSGNFAKIHVLTLSVGQLVLQIASVKKLEHNELTAQMEFQTIGPRLTDALIQVWPVKLRGVQWPPSLSFNDRERHLMILAYRFGGEKA